MRESAKDLMRASERRRRASSRLALAMAALAAGAGAAYAQAPPAPAFIPGPTDPPDVFGVFPNYANSPLPVLNDPANCPGPSFCGIRKFVDTLPGLGAAGANNLGQYLPVAVPDTATYPGSDYYEIELGEYSEQMHSDLPPTKLRGYRQTNMGGTPFHYLGPILIAQRDQPVRIKFTNRLPTGAGGNLFIPVDTTYMGAGEGPLDAAGNSCEPGAGACVPYAQNRATIHLHGATTPWISDGTVHQWITPAGESTPYPRGVSVRNVPDMWFDAAGNTVAAGTPGATNDPGLGTMTFFYTNQQSARLMFYHDHASGLTRLNVYAGMAAGYLLTDPVEQNLVTQGVLPQDQIPLVLQDKTFVPDDTRPFANLVGSFPSQLKAQDPTWDASRWGGFGQLWFPHVYMPNQNPYDLAGANAMGRWDYGPWFWPPFTGLTYGPIPNPYAANAGEPPFAPGTPDGRLLSPSGVPESFLDTPVVNGTAYPTLTLDPKAYRFRILNAADDRYWNLSLFVADSTMTAASGVPNTEVRMVPFNSSQNAASPFPTWWYDGSVANPFDDRVGGVPDPATRGPAMVQVGTEGGFLPAPVVIKNQPVNYVMNKRDITIGNVKEHALFLGPAERADVVVDFTNFAGRTLLLYNDGPAPVPAADPRLDYFTGGPDMTDTGGAPPTLPGFGPNTRTILQIVVRNPGGATAAAPVDDVNQALLASLNASLPAAFAASQEPIIVPQSAYNGVYTSTPVTDVIGSAFATIQATSMTFTPYRQASPLLVEMEPKSIIEDFQTDYGRMNAMLGVEIKHTNVTNQTSIPQYYVDPPTELVKLTTDPFTVPLGAPSDGTQIWKITHNGVDTHAVHFHMFHVQIVNRVGWDGAIRPPEPNELGWKDTVRMNPLEDIVVALRPRTLGLPFKVGNSARLMNPARPPGSPMGFTNVDPQGNPVTVTNDLVNFGWEYVWHCHLLGHEENDMMRALVVANPPEQVTNLAGGFASPTQVSLAWTDNSLTANGFRIERATDALFTQNLAATTPATYATTFTDTVPPDASYYYRVIALNTVGSSVLGYPTLTAESVPSATAAVAPVPAATLSPDALTFGTRVVGTVGPAQTVTLSSVGTGSLSGISAGLSGANAGDFGTSTTCGATLAPGSSCTVSVTFSPTAAGSRFATLTVTTSDPIHPQFTVSLSGTGVVSALSVSPTSLAFSSTLNVRTAAQTVTLRNTGTTTVTGIGIALGGANASQFAQSNTCGRNLAGGGSCTIGVTFRPTSVGAKTAELTVNFAGVGSPLSVPLSGAVLAPALAVSPASLAFGRQPIRTTSAPQTVTVSNTGAATLVIGSIGLGGANPGQFVLARNTCGGSVAAGASCSVDVSFAPRSRGAKSAVLNVNVAAPAISRSVSLTGTGQ